MVVDDHPSVAVQDFAARSQHRNRLDAVLQSAFLVDLRVANLQVPEAGDQEQKDADGQVLKEGDLLRRELRVVAQKLVRGGLLVFASEMKFHDSIPSSVRHF
jgi:hypothetical protein